MREIRYCLAATVVLAYLLSTCVTDCAELSHQDAAPTQSSIVSGLQNARARFAFLPLFDFERYKLAFGKKYASFVEEIARARLFLGRAFRAFVSAINYKRRRSSVYLAINQMSDWTPDELRSITLHLRKEVPKRTPPHDEPVPVASLGAIESAVADIVDNTGSGAALLAVETRKRRDVAAEREITLEDIAREPVDEAGEVGQRVSSNNPEYEPPEQISFGSAGDLPADSIPKRVGYWLSGLPGNEFVSWLMSTAFGRPRAESEETKVEARSQSAMEIDQVGVIGANSQLPDEVFIDHRDECMFAPRNQNKCGSCYAFAVIAIYEWLYCKATGRKTAFSEQYIIDCGAGVIPGLEGCEGGYTELVPDFVHAYGLELRGNYPYRARTDQCPYDRYTPYQTMGFLRVSTDPIRHVAEPNFERALQRGPMALVIAISSTFHEYGGGVDLGEGCDPNDVHAMVLVGSGREDGQEYWLLRNSHGAAFGQGGYYKLNKQAKHCLDDKGAYMLTGFTLYGNPGGVNMWHHSDPVARRYHEKVPVDTKYLEQLG